MSRLHRLSQLTAALRHHVRFAWADDCALASGLDADLARMEAELEAMADAAMAGATETPRTRCHCGAPLATARHGAPLPDSCGHRHCIAIAREARHAIQRHRAGRSVSSQTSRTR